jgi:hypothetical protein
MQNKKVFLNYSKIVVPKNKTKQKEDKRQQKSIRADCSLQSAFHIANLEHLTEAASAAKFGIEILPRLKPTN